MIIIYTHTHIYIYISILQLLNIFIFVVIYICDITGSNVVFQTIHKYVLTLKLTFYIIIIFLYEALDYTPSICNIFVYMS